MKIHRKISLFFGLLVVVALVLLVAPVWAQNINDLNSHNTTDDSVTTSISGGDSLGIGVSHALGDVDINQCIVTHQKGSFVVSWQGYDYNLWCMGEVFDAKGLPQMGALMRCDIQEIRRHFDSDGACLAANTVVEHHNDQEQEALAAVQADFNVARERHDDELERVQMEQAMLYEQIEEQRVLIASTRPVNVQQVVPRYTDKQRAAVQEILEK